jgi:hypothetical protein
MPDFGCRKAGGQRKNQPLKGSIADLRGCYSPLESLEDGKNMAKRTITDAIRIIHNCAVQYGKNLAGNSLLFVTSQNNSTVCFETIFLPRNYLHLTGVITDLKGDLFYQAAINNRLSPNEIALTSDGKTEQKLDVLPQLMNIHLTARMVGDYDNSRPLLIADKFAGTVTMAMGFINVNGRYIPKTALKVDMRDITEKATRLKIVAIFVKPSSDDLYKNLTYLAKGLCIDDEMFSKILCEKVDEPNLTATFVIPRRIYQNGET